MMKAGTETGSLINHLMSRNAPKPEVGMGVTILHWTDRSAGTIIEVNKSGKTIKVQGDKVTRVDKNGMSECQEYQCEPDPNGPISTWRLGKRGWRRLGDPCGPGLSLGHRNPYHDYSF